MIWLVGCGGMLGRQLSLALKKAGLPFIGTDRELSIVDPAALAEFAAINHPRWIINCAAYTAVDKAEDEPALALAINAEGPANLAAVAKNFGAKLLHISTDYVFDGKGIADGSGGLRPYRADDPINPQSVYGATKAAGEQSVRNGLTEHIILRTAWLYGQFGPNFVYTMLRLMRQKPSLGVVADQCGSPTWATDLAMAIVAIVNTEKPAWGTYHYSDAGILSWFEFAQEIYRQGLANGIVESGCVIEKLASHQYPAKAVRPAWSALDKTSIQANFKVAVPDWKESLEKFMSEIKTTWKTNSFITPVEQKK